jgi:hypothetical protein
MAESHLAYSSDSSDSSESRSFSPLNNRDDDILTACHASSEMSMCVLGLPLDLTSLSTQKTEDDETSSWRPIPLYARFSQATWARGAAAVRA